MNDMPRPDSAFTVAETLVAALAGLGLATAASVLLATTQRTQAAAGARTRGLSEADRLVELIGRSIRNAHAVVGNPTLESAETSAAKQLVLRRLPLTRTESPSVRRVWHQGTRLYRQNVIGNGPADLLSTAVESLTFRYAVARTSQSVETLDAEMLTPTERDRACGVEVDLVISHLGFRVREIAAFSLRSNGDGLPIARRTSPGLRLDRSPHHG